MRFRDRFPMPVLTSARAVLGLVLGLWLLSAYGQPAILWENRVFSPPAPDSSKENICQSSGPAELDVQFPQDAPITDGHFATWDAGTIVGNTNRYAANAAFFRCSVVSSLNGPLILSIGDARCSVSTDPVIWWVDAVKETCTCNPRANPPLVLSGGKCVQRPATCTQLIDMACHGGKNNGGGSGCVGNPCSPGTGNKFEPQPVYQGRNGFRLSLTYNTFDDETRHFGRRWRDTFDRQIYRNANGTGTTTFAFRPDGKSLNFSLSGALWVPDADTSDTLTELKNPSGATAGWQLHLAATDETETYDSAGNLLTIRSRVGLVQTMSYSDGTGGPNGGVFLDSSGQPTPNKLPAGLLIRATDNYGRTLAFAYDMATARVARITDPAGNVYRFGYDSAKRLVSIAFPDGGTRTFAYNEAANTNGVSFPYALTGIIDENGSRYATFKYDSQERAVSTEHAGGAGRYVLSYGSNLTTVTDPLGTTRSYAYQNLFGAFKNTSVTGPACPQCGPAAQTFDANGNVASSTDWNGNRTSYVYDPTRNLPVLRTEGLTAGGATTAQTRTITTQWHPTLDVPARIAEPLRITTYVYNGDGGAQCGFEADGSTLVPGVPCSKTIQATTDATGAAGLGATPGGTQRTWTYTYNANGSVLTMDGPRIDVADTATYTYYANDDPDLGKRGSLATTTNALGQVTSITAYNPHGQPVTIVDPNGLITTLGYDARERLVSRNVGGETTTYDYDFVGQLTKVTLPDGSVVSYTYDSAHRLTAISDTQANRIAYTLDAMGNRTQEQVFDPAGNLAQIRTRVFDALNRLAQDIGAASQTTSYTYDDQGNVKSVTDPLTHVTINQYDALNRLVQVTDPGTGVTQYRYDGLGQLTSVTDPRNLTTGYTYDGLTNLNQQMSPDTGAMTSTYDGAGNLSSRTDAKGQTTTYSFDSLNRIALMRFADNSAQTYSYDQGTNGIGHLTQITEADANGLVTSNTAYAYDPHGRVTQETRMIAGVFYSTAYRYDNAGRLTGVTYPSGRQINYTLDSLGRIFQVSTVPPGGTEQLVATGVAYQPFGSVRSYTLSNGQQVVRGYDQDGRIASYNVPGQTFAIGYDAASRISFISDAANPANANTYGYDFLDRLTSAVVPGNQYSYAYDAVGNRTSKTVGSATDTYVYETASNRIAGVTSQAGSTRFFAFDPNGSTTNDGINQYTYDARGRMVQSVGALGTTTYQVNALGQRIRKTNSSEDRVFHYDANGHTIAETDPGGAVLREYIYLGDIPLAVVQ